MNYSTYFSDLLHNAAQPLEGTEFQWKEEKSKRTVFKLIQRSNSWPLTLDLNQF